jgi:hypothetical protein
MCVLPPKNTLAATYTQLQPKKTIDKYKAALEGRGFIPRFLVKKLLAKIDLS